MSTVKANTIEPASGGTVTITGAALTTPALGTAASGTLTNCTGLPASTGLSGTTLASSVVNASINAITPSGGTLSVTGELSVAGGGTFGGMGSFTGPAIGLAVRQSSSAGYTGMRIFNDLNSSASCLEIDYAGSAYAGALVPGGPTGESASITTTGAYPLVLGTNNTARAVFDASGVLNYGTYTGTPGTITGYIEIKDIGGTVRKLAVIS